MTLPFTPTRKHANEWAQLHFARYQPSMLESLAVQRSRLGDPFVVADFEDRFEHLDELQGVTRLVGLGGLHQALFGAHQRMTMVKVRLAEQRDTLTVLTVDETSDHQFNAEQLGMAADIWRNGRAYGETLLLLPGATPGGGAGFSREQLWSSFDRTNGRPARQREDGARRRGTTG